MPPSAIPATDIVANQIVEETVLADAKSNKNTGGTIGGIMGGTINDLTDRA